MNFIAKIGIYNKAFLTYNEKLLIKNMKKLYLYYVNFEELEEFYLSKKDKNPNHNFLAKIIIK